MLVIGNDERAATSLGRDMGQRHFRVLGAVGGEEGLRVLQDTQPDCVVLDTELPDMNGLEALRMIRQQSTVPLIAIFPSTSGEEVIRALQMGADSAVRRPLSSYELRARITALIRRASMPPLLGRSIVRVDDRLTINFQTREVIVNGRTTKLRPTEWRLLYHLVQNAGNMMTHEALLSRTWGREYRDAISALRFYIHSLRQKLEPDPARPRYIFGERNAGYRFVDFQRTYQSHPQPMSQVVVPQIDAQPHAFLPHATTTPEHHQAPVMETTAM